MTDIKLDPVTHKMMFTETDIVFTDNEDDYIRQKIKIKLLFFYGEWFLDKTQGIKFFEEVFVKNPNMTTVDAMFKNAILEDGFFTDIVEYQSNVDLQTRMMSIKFLATKKDGSIFTFDGQGINL